MNQLHLKGINKFTAKVFRHISGFTLAEVLITLGIIGVVAAMTIPALMTNTRHIMYSARLKKFYSMMKQSILMAEDELGNVSSWDNSLPEEDYLKTYIMPYVKGSISTDTTEASDDDPNYNKIGDTYNEYRGRMIYQLNDGSYFYIRTGTCMDITYDVNGATQPNKQGYDQFRFLYCPEGNYWCDGNGGFCTYHTNTQMTREERLKACKSSSPYCSSLIEMDNWKFEKDYPYKN